MDRRVASLIVVATLAGGCGDDLLGDVGVSELFPVAGDLGDLSWEVRWYQGADLGFHAPCTVWPVPEGPSWTDAWADGFVDVQAPEIPSAPVVIDGPGYTFALGFAVLLEGTPDARPATTADPLAGAWGLGSYYALLHAEGDTERLGQDLAIQLADGPVRQGWQWLEIDDPFAAADATPLHGNLLTADPSIPMTLDDGALPVDEVGLAFGLIADLAGGSGPTEPSFEDCP